MLMIGILSMARMAHQSSRSKMCSMNHLAQSACLDQTSPIFTQLANQMHHSHSGTSVCNEIQHPNIDMPLDTYRTGQMNGQLYLPSWGCTS